MSNAHRISGRGAGLFGQIGRAFFLAMAAIGGLFMLVFSAAFALFAVAGIAVLGFIVFAFFWLRAKILGKPFGPKAQFEAARKDMEAQFKQMQGEGAKDEADGPIIDARETPQGWSVDD